MLCLKSALRIEPPSGKSWWVFLNHSFAWCRTICVGRWGGMRGMAEVSLKRLRDGDVAPPERYLKMIQTKADRLGNLVNQLLMLAKVTHAD